MNKIRNILITIILLVSSFLFAQDCVDDPTGAYAPMGGCETVISWVTCDGSFGGYNVSAICAGTCESCVGIFGPTGCDIPDMSLSILEDGSVLYNTLGAIAGFEFVVDGDGVVVTGASGGA